MAQMAAVAQEMMKSLTDAQHEFFLHSTGDWSPWNCLIRAGYNPREQSFSAEEQALICRPLYVRKGQVTQQLVRETHTLQKVETLLRLGIELFDILASGELRGRLFKDQAKNWQRDLDKVYEHGEALITATDPESLLKWNYRWGYFFKEGESFVRGLERLLKKPDLSLADLKKFWFTPQDLFIYLTYLSWPFHPD